MFTKQYRCLESERTMYGCQFARLLILSVVAATLLTISPSILLEGCRRLSGIEPFDNHILGVSKCSDKVCVKVHILCVCVCVWWLCPSVCVLECMVGRIEGDWQTNQAPETPSLCLLVRLPPPTLCLHLWLCKPPHYVGALKWQWKLWLIFVKTHSLLPRFRMRVWW